MTDVEIAQLIKKAVGSKLPDWKADYYGNICDKLQVHTKGMLFAKVDTLFPHEHPDSKAHCINTYEPITKGSILKGVNNIERVFCNSGFSASASDNTLEFINESRFDGKNLFSFFVEKWIDQTIGTDPNSYIAVYPGSYLEDYPGNPVRFVGSDRILAANSEYVAFICESESDKQYAVEDKVMKREVFHDAEIGHVNARTVVEQTYNRRVVCKFTKPVYHLFTKDFLLRFYEEGKTYEWEMYPFASPLENLPVWKVRAQPLMLDICESFVEPFIPFGNLALLQHRNHRAVDLMFSYPRMSEVQTPCDNLNCRNGEVFKADDPTEKTSCSRCHGTGWISPQSPYKVYKKNIETGLTDPEVSRAILATPPVDFHTPETSILNYSKDSWKDYLAMAEEAIFVIQKQKTGNVESAKAKEEDKEAQYGWVQKIGKAWNQDVTRALQTIEAYLNAAAPADVNVELPISFALVTEAEAFDALNVIIGSSAPVFVKAQQVENFITKFVSKSNPVVKAIRVLKRIDPLLFYSNGEVQGFKSNNVVSPEAYTTHVYAYMMLMKLHDEDMSLFDKEDKEIEKLVLAAIDELRPAEGSLKDNLIDVV